MVFDLPKDESPIIKVIGVGGGGSNAVTHMYKQGIVGVDFAICNTDAQAMEMSPVPTRIHLGPDLTEGRGAGSKPNIGKLACEESIDEVRKYLENNCRMLFITAGMGGGTGTGAAPIIAKAAKEMDVLTVGIVTLPFTFEGRRRTNQGMEGLLELKKHVDTLIVISNDKLRQIHGNLSLTDAFCQADNILTTAAKGIAEIITVPGYVNVDFEDVNTVMRDSGVAIMGTASAEGEDRARRAVDEALHSPLLEDNDIRGAQHILLNITSGTREVTMDEIFEITEFVQEEAGYGTDLIWGNCFDETLGDKISVTVIATGFERHKFTQKKTGEDRVVVSLDDDEPNARPEKKTGLADIGYEEDRTPSAQTFDFEDVRAKVDKNPSMRYSYEEPYVPPSNRDQIEEERRRQAERDAKRRERQRSMGLKLNNPHTVNELENEPAFLRRGVNLDKVPNSEEPALSKWTISDDDQPEIREGNSFLHDNVD
ncbi:cell division protein FtsZ [Flavilitoribacter nigricans]|uniref:Cell division protein FtsZ n=1 Tax=Flavilitoribacter nigricans (strain ATCC 23147 / DSM 23189 / NBRC 102662 / NCIMB 1420 / SS-2) TaxID=1122177 RepID=A0A2D0NA12_FLAN2|nr:cell division protein FtsZ [Flavilitoribacter nigricans]PHN05218.1 cell division protein FtsZ [Flavilitoribacter nigricans DSM 23189 = NBRC 102662]